jgi:hypothetical protein
MLTAGNAAEGLGAWGIVQGKIYAAAAVDNNLYLNFGQDWRTDFTIVVDAAARREFSGKGIDPLQLSGKTVRVHGWIEKFNGPAVKLSDIAWLEILPDAPEASKVPIDKP